MDLSAPTNRFIVHLDLDCFFAAVETLLNPNLQHVPLAIGGRPKSRSVICTANYLARKFGVRSAMPVDLALKKCPQLVLRPPRISIYKEYSEEVFETVRFHCQIIQQVGIDEAYLDLSDQVQSFSEATAFAQMLQQSILTKTSLKASLGVAPNKFLAKVASDWKKPFGLFAISPEDAYEFCTTLPVGKINGVGPVLTNQLLQLGIRTCQDLRSHDLPSLYRRFGPMGLTLFQFARGLDSSKVSCERVRKSLSVEQTFTKSILGPGELKSVLSELLEELVWRLNQKDRAPIKGMSIKLKNDQFELKRKDFALSKILSAKEFSQSIAQFPFERFSEELLNELPGPYRLMGVGVRFAHRDSPPGQLSFNFEASAS